MRPSRGLGAVAAAVLALLASSRVARAQATPPHDEAIDVQLFDYSIGPKTFFSVDNADPASKKQLLSVFDSFRKQIRVGYFQLPNALADGAVQPSDSAPQSPAKGAQ